MKRLAILIFILISFNLIYAKCEGEQIDINSASLKDLDKLVGIGEVKAQAIIDARPFDSLDDLIKVYGIGEITLEKIKEQELACVDGEDEDKYEKEFEDDENKEGEEILLDKEKIEERESEVKTNVEVIKLIPKDIKTENSENLSKNNLAVYGLFTFCILLAGLYFLRVRRYNKNEFN